MLLQLMMKFLFPPNSVFFTATSLLTLVSMANGGLDEVRGKHVQYSKFFGVGSHAAKAISKVMLSGRAAMVVVYTPSFLIGVASFLLFPAEGFRFLLLRSAITIHFGKRVFEALFIHKYSGEMGLTTLTFIVGSYVVSSASMIYSQHLIQGLSEPQFDLKYAGIVLFLVGVSGNFYHHYLLSKLRGKGGKEYKIPKGGLFALVICPHYLFEVLGFWGITFIAQTLYTFSFTLGSTLFLMGRSYATRRWYLSKFEDFPKGVKAMIPYVF